MSIEWADSPLNVVREWLDAASGHLRPHELGHLVPPDTDGGSAANADAASTGATGNVDDATRVVESGPSESWVLHGRVGDFGAQTSYWWQSEIDEHLRSVSAGATSVMTDKDASQASTLDLGVSDNGAHSHATIVGT